MAFADVSDEEFQQLREQLAAVSARLEELAAENAELRNAREQDAEALAEVKTSVAAVKESAPSAAGASWTDRISLDGDFRYRYEMIDPEGSPTRKRNRIRARTNVRADVGDDVEIGFGLATGGDDPVSTNQTLGGGGSSMRVSLNLAYADWEVIDGLHLIGQDEVGHVAFDNGTLERQRCELGMVTCRKDGLAEPGYRFKGRGQVDLLERPRTQHLGIHLPGQGHDRRAVHLCVPQTG